VRNILISLLLTVISVAGACTPGNFDDRPLPDGRETDSGLTKLDFASLQTALYDDRRMWEMCDGADFGCIIDPTSRYTLTIQLQGTVLVGRHGIYAGLKRPSRAEFQTTNDIALHDNRHETLDGKDRDYLSQLYPRAVFVWERNIRRLRG
jgi:hypothetical protein